MDEIITIALSALLTLIGRFFLRVASLGQWKCEPMGSDAHRIHSAAGALSYRHDGRRVVTPTGQMLAGTLLCASPLLLLLMVHVLR